MQERLSDQQLKQFGAELDAIRERIQRQIGSEDVDYIKRVDRFSKTMEVLGRTLIHFSIEPVGFLSGVTALWLHKQLQATEVGHTTLHGAFDHLPGAEAYQSRTYRWDTPIDEESWRAVHNIRHHQYTNIAGKDPDIHFGPLRLNERTPHKDVHRKQERYAKLLAANFAFGLNLQYTGVADFLHGNGRGGFDFITDRSAGTRRDVFKKLLRSSGPYYAKNFVFFPLLAGPMFGKVLLGNWMAETMRDVYSALTIYCGHVGAEVKDYPEGTRAGSRARWYAMQVEASNNFEVSLPVSILCGALDCQIEHHLFPKFPTNRLRQIAPEVREICERHGVEYRTDTWGATLGRVFARIRQLARPSEHEASGNEPALGLAA